MHDVTAQTKDTTSYSDTYIGINVGRATQSVAPFNNSNYNYQTTSIKCQLRHEMASSKSAILELLVEPGFYIVNHQLLNEDFIEPSEPDFLEKRQRFTRKRTFYEYAIQLGMMVRFDMMDKLNPYILASIGPMISSAETERLKKGFAFSSIFGIGSFYRVESIYLSFGFLLRHNSNANLSQPNAGHNSVGIELGLSVPIRG